MPHQQISTFKERILSIVNTQLNSPNSNMMEARELKTITDIVLNLEDSYANQQDEGKNVRKLTRLIDKYSLNNTSIPSPIIDVDYVK